MQSATLKLLRTVFEVRVLRNETTRPAPTDIALVLVVSSLSYKFSSFVSRDGASPPLALEGATRVDRPLPRLMCLQDSSKAWSAR